MLGPRGWDEVCRPDPGRTFSHDPQACQKDRVRRREGRDVLDGVTLITRSGRNGGATSPGPCCRNPLSITVCGAVCGGGRPPGRRVSGRTVRGLPQGCVGFAGRPSFAAPFKLKLVMSSARVRWPGWQAGWLACWYGPMLCQVQISYRLANEMRDFATRENPRSAVGWLPIHNPRPRSCST